jgi:hypothetical protein
MRSGRFAEDVLALFTTREVAASIVGDLAEQSQSRRRGWFTCEIVRLAFALCFRSLIAAPGRALRLAGVGLAVYFGAEVTLFVTIGLPWYPWHRVHEAGFWVRLGLVVFFSNLLTGAILARRRASATVGAVAPLTALWLAAWLIWPLFASRAYPWPSQGVWRGGVPWPPMVAGPWTLLSAELIFPLLYLLPLLLGAVLAQRGLADKTAARAPRAP